MVYWHVLSNVPPFEIPSFGVAHTHSIYITCLRLAFVGVSKNRGTPKSSILIGFFLINHPFWGTPIFGNVHIILSKPLTPPTQKTPCKPWGVDVSACQFGQLRGEWVGCLGFPKFFRPSQGRKEGRGFSGWSSFLPLNWCWLFFFSSEDFGGFHV